MSDPDKLSREEIADFRAHHRYREDLRRKNREAIQEEIRLGFMPRSEAREKLGITIVDLSAVLPKPQRPTTPTRWTINDAGFIGAEGEHPPIFRAAARAHNNKLWEAGIPAELT